MFEVETLPKTPFRVIAGVDYAVWSYKVSWEAGDAPPARLALVLSGSSGIEDPALYPGEPLIQGTSLFRSADGRLYIGAPAPAAPQTDLTLSFIAPSASGAGAALSLAQESTEEGSWSLMPFASAPGGDAALVQMVDGPSEALALVPASPDLSQARGASRRVPKATLVSLQLPGRALFREQGAAIEKFNFLQRLSLAPGEVTNVIANLQVEGIREAIPTLQAFEGLAVSSARPSAETVATLPTSSLLAFGEAVVAQRKQQMPEAGTQPRVRREPRTTTQTQPAQQPMTVRSGSLEFPPALNATVNYHNAFAALAAFRNAFTVSPIGMLNLERLEMTPAGMLRGELIATVPLAPGEKTTVTHKEWSVTSQEFTSIVTDSLENFSETGVTENSELAQATSSQTAHSNQFNVNATVTGSYGPVTATVSTGFGAQDAASASANESRRHAVSTTRSASSRVKQEHKVTISTTTTTGTLDSTSRILENRSAIDPIRVDYFSLLRKWHVGLYRYGLRMTYDIAVPEPGATLRAIYAKMQDLQDKLGEFSFTVAAADINLGNYLWLASQYSVVVPPPPEDPMEFSVISTYTESGDTEFFGVVRVMEIDIPEGYAVTSANLYINLQSDVHISDILITRVPLGPGAFAGDPTPVPFLAGREGKQYLMYATKGSPSGALELDLQLKALPRAIANWQQQAWAVLFGAAQAQYFQNQQKIQAELQLLNDKISNVNTLTLRREENEEIMKAALKWILGPAFAFMPDDVLAEFIAQQSPWGGVDLSHGSTAYDTGMSVTQENWATMLKYQEMIKFINQAIEWENVLYFVYPYFWDIPFAWSFIRSLRHNDAKREAFLRAGSARVVLTVRRGWEEAWVTFVETGGFGKALLPGHPYMSIAREVQAYDLTNYPGIPPANPGGGTLPDDGTCVSAVTTDNLAASPNPVDIAVASSEGFRVGYSLVIGDYAIGETVAGEFSTDQEAQMITAVGVGQITVAKLNNAHDGTAMPVPLRQAGEAGHLIAEWFEYTPTPGTDIAVTSNLATIV